MNRLILFGAAALVLVAGFVIWQTRGAPVPAGDLPYGAVNAQEAADIDTSSIIEMKMGPDDAKVRIVEYASFTCPHCARFHEDQFKKLKADYIDTNKVQFIYRDVFFDRFGLWASMVARCGGPERFFGITEMIYAQQKEWIGTGQDPVQIANNLRKIGKVAGLNDDELDACLNDSEKAQTLVAWYQQNAEADDITSTPTLVINGKKHSNMSYAELSDLIDESLTE
jgi:protein-disulfide isomerase